ncbi:MAG: hypothetical protein EPO07_11180 [Verrucomicrobia bacterium]|nr:MAG: hypothetical protein EPO07_11180 [Verrucomicrobiota bacterium]
MAEVDFYASFQDWSTILDAVLSKTSALALWDGWYVSKDIAFFESATDELLALARKKRSCFLIERSLRKEAQYGLVQQTLGRESGKFRIDVGRLPSGLHLILPACFEKEGKTCLNSGSLVRPREVFNHATATWGKPEPLRSDLYEQCKFVLLSKLRKLKIGASTIKIGPDALDLVNTGKAKLVHMPGGVKA